MTIEEIKKKKKELGYSNKMLSELSGVPIGTVQKILSGETESPRYDTLCALTKALSDDHEPLAVADAAAEYIAAEHDSVTYEKTEKTIEDYIALPEGARIELIDGQFYDMAAPTTIHQALGLEISFLLKDYIRNNNRECVPFVAPTDVQLDCDDKTMVQPDVLVVCDRSKITKERIVGAPDLVIEVISPSRVTVDIFIKVQKYKKAGVKEYWLVFPEEKKVMVYDFNKSDMPEHYTFEDSIPVAIWNGECRLDFKQIYKRLEFMYQ
ncbi:MAG: Uma2 family endonuclease [Lachnospiraceae bacterium]|nr:Uma2 family endonuclease [Lachnospiraceae bacterium]